ncbi:hypothetical protein LCGC14_1283100 [marine sediment metagenome]|uniref:Uncharacterized protein n=1 Tax=marine sediment metagenome TaxID=412755 RepID=A0A0F9NXR1_9ZZZZ|nr:helix-hairpin-helix domain-containing protein [archaeon]
MLNDPEKLYGVYANEEKSLRISDILKNDLQSLIRSNRPQVRIFLGDNGTGKSTHFEFFKQILESYYQNTNFFFEIDLRHIAEKTEEGLWLAIFNQIFESLSKREDIIKILTNYDTRKLRKTFKSSPISKHVKNFGQDSSEDYFYGKEFQKISNIQSFFNGIIDILMENKILTIIAIDEVQQIEKWGEPVFQAFLESFVSSTYDRYMKSNSDSRLFFILSFLVKKPESRKVKYEFLDKQSPGFVSRMKGREIVFNDFSENEHKNALKLIAEITNLSPEECSKFKAETKSKLTYWMTRNNPREFGKYIKKVFKKLDLLKLSASEKREIYEKEARGYIKPVLLTKGYTYIAEKPENVSGYDFDVYANLKQRTIIKKCAFGEIKTTQRKNLKGEVEEFSRWLSDIKKTSVFNHSDNYYFFISPFDPTNATQRILEQYSIEWIKFEPPELIFEVDKEIIDEGIKGPRKIKVNLVTIETPLKSLKIPQLGPGRLRSLEAEKITTIEDLKETNLGILAEKIKGISKKMLLNWKSACEKLINP